jgi:hypothetical protein
MRNLAEKQAYAQPVLEYGRIVGSVEDLFLVESAFGSLRAERAVSCLVWPRSGDTVLLSVDAPGSCFILSVLKRTGEPGSTDLVIDGDASMQVRGGGLSLSSTEDMSLAARNGMDLVSRRVSVIADEGKATIYKFSFLGRIFRSQVKSVKCVAGSVENICRRLTQRLGNAFRFVEEHEEVQCGSARHLVEETMTSQAKNTMIVAEEIVTVNGKLVNLG